jgi:hypothetical protein
MNLPFSFRIARIYARLTGPIRSRLTTEERMPNAEVQLRQADTASADFPPLLRRRFSRSGSGHCHVLAYALCRGEGHC